MSRWQIGDVRISKFVEKEFSGNVRRFLLLDATPEACKEVEWLTPHFVTEKGGLRLSIHAFVVETPSCRIIVEYLFRHDNFLRDLESASFPASSFDYVERLRQNEHPL